MPGATGFWLLPPSMPSANLVMLRRLRLAISGRVQGVGFRPTVYRYALVENLTGFVQNNLNGILIEIQGPTASLDRFLKSLHAAPPMQSRIDDWHQKEIPLHDDSEFKIIPSQDTGQPRLGFPPDLGLCPDCLVELSDPHNRRHHYPFINCVNCGPRFTIIQKLPYDRMHTTMSAFALCPECQHEYVTPGDRRFDAQPNACPVCGPACTFLDASGQSVPGNALHHTIQALRAGQLVAIKSLGGYHLACLATRAESIQHLREVKQRPEQALAVMFPSVESLEQEVILSPAELADLSSAQAPMVIAPRRQEGTLPPTISPDTNTLGVMLPFTPIHHLILSATGPLIMTSANRHEEPILSRESEISPLLGNLADAALTHNRPIERRCDDSVVLHLPNQRIFVRRSRGYVPDAIELPFSGPSVLAYGGDGKNAFCLTQDNRAVCSQHIGDLAEWKTFTYYQEQIQAWKRLLAVTPTLHSADLHPDYRSTRYAQADSAGSAVLVQHHHAHIASCMAEYKLTRPVLGIAWDGTGYGCDHTLWGGEFLIADYRACKRAAWFKPLPLPGGEAAINDPRQMALSFLRETFPDAGEAAHIARSLWPAWDPSEQELIFSLLAKRIQCPLTSSVGRLFDAVSALLGITHSVSYEGQAAVRLEHHATSTPDRRLDFTLAPVASGLEINVVPMIRQLVADRTEHGFIHESAAMFHATLAQIMVEVATRLCSENNLDTIVLSGGVFQNRLLIHLALPQLRKIGLHVFLPQQVSPNDSGIALGQAAVALARHIHYPSQLGEGLCV